MAESRQPDAQQISAYTAWVNSQIRKRAIKPVAELSDLADGVILRHLIEALSGERLERVSLSPLTPVAKRTNVECILGFIRGHNIRSQVISVDDILAGDKKAIMRCILALAAHYKPASVKPGLSDSGSGDTPRPASSIPLATVRPSRITPPQPQTPTRASVIGAKTVRSHESALGSPHYLQHATSVDCGAISHSGSDEGFFDDILKDLTSTRQSVLILQRMIASGEPLADLSKEDSNVFALQAELMRVNMNCQALEADKKRLEQRLRHVETEASELKLTLHTKESSMKHLQEEVGRLTDAEECLPAPHHRRSVNGCNPLTTTRLVYYLTNSATPFITTIQKPLSDVVLADIRFLFERSASIRLRYHFKTTDPEFGVVKEELTMDCDYVPGWNKRIVCWIESPE